MSRPNPEYPPPQPACNAHDLRELCGHDLCDDCAVTCGCAVAS